MGFSLIEGNLIAVKDTVTEIEHPHESRSLVQKDYARWGQTGESSGSFRWNRRAASRPLVVGM